MKLLSFLSFSTQRILSILLRKQCLEARNFFFSLHNYLHNATVCRNTILFLIMNYQTTILVCIHERHVIINVNYPKILNKNGIYEDHFLCKRYRSIDFDTDFDISVTNEFSNINDW